MTLISSKSITNDSNSKPNPKPVIEVNNYINGQSNYIDGNKNGINGNENKLKGNNNYMNGNSN